MFAAVHPQEQNKFKLEIRVDYKKQQYILTEEQKRILQNQGLNADIEEFLRNINNSEIFKLYSERLAVYGSYYDNHDKNQCRFLMLSFCLIGIPCLVNLNYKNKPMREYEVESKQIVDSFSKQAQLQFKELQQRNNGFKYSFVQDKELYCSNKKRTLKYPRCNRQVIFVIRNYDPEMQFKSVFASRQNQETDLQRRLRMAKQQEQQKQNF